MFQLPPFIQIVGAPGCSCGRAGVAGALPTSNFAQ
jgi:hypothetical protein